MGISLPKTSVAMNPRPASAGNGGPPPRQTGIALAEPDDENRRPRGDDRASKGKQRPRRTGAPSLEPDHGGRRQGTAHKAGKRRKGHGASGTAKGSAVEGADGHPAVRAHPNSKKRRPRRTSRRPSARYRGKPQSQTDAARNLQDMAAETERRQASRAAELRSLFVEMSRAANSHWTKGNSKIDIFYAEGQVSDRTGCYVSTFLSLAGGQPNRLSLTAIVARNVNTPSNAFLLHINAVNSNAKRARALFDPEFRQVVLISEADCYRKEDLTSAVSALFRRFSRLLNDPYLGVALAEGRATYTGKANLEEIPGPMGPVQNQE